MNETGADVILYDGVCGLCDRWVQFVIPRDRDRRFRFAPLQGPWAQAFLRAAGRSVESFDTMLVVTRAGVLLERSDGVFHVLRALGGLWAALALLRFLPWRDRLYDFIAARRSGIFGRLDSCRLPSASERALFVDAGV